ncbi:MAG: class I SAM-dependent methyltransferase [Syntrophobacteraceae bacterium]|jgi:SAM-dependent methyltransferase
MKLPVIFHGAMHAVLKRWGNSTVRKRIWDQEYGEGHWLDSEHIERPSICDLIDKYLPNRGTLLDLGCSDGLIARTQCGLGKYTGVDVSKIAIEAARKATDKNKMNACEWVCSDISTFVPSCNADVILFRYSLYYLKKHEVGMTLKRYRRYLSGNGVFIVVMDNPKRHKWVADLIRKNFDIIELIDDNPVVLVFR